MPRARYLLLVMLICAIAAIGCSRPKATGGSQGKGPVVAPPTGVAKPTLMVFAGSASQTVTEKLCTQFAQKENCVVRDTYGGSGEVLRQFVQEQVGDVYIPGSDDFMDKARKEDVVLPETTKTLCYLLPVIAVEKGNPKGIKTLADLGKPGLKVALADAQSVCLGAVAEEVLKAEGVTDSVKRNVVSYTGSCGQTRVIVETGQVDAVIGWDTFAFEAPTKVDVVKLPKKLQRFRTVPAAVIKFTQQRELAQKLIDFLSGPDGKAAFRAAGFTVEVKP